MHKQELDCLTMSKESQAFKNKFPRLVVAVGPSIKSITDECFGNGLISLDTYDELLELEKVFSDKARKLLRNILTNVEKDSSCFDKFITVLNGTECGAIGEELMGELRDLENRSKIEKAELKEKSTVRSQICGDFTPMHGTTESAEVQAFQPYASGVQVVDLCIQKLKLWIREENMFMKRVAFVMTNFGVQMSRSGSNGGIWQLSSAAFQDTKDHMSHRRLPMKYERLMELYGIDWMSVTYSDLNKPLHSAIAARLYLSNNPASIPPSQEIAEQAAYWKYKYMSGAGESAAFYTKKVLELENQMQES